MNISDGKPFVYQLSRDLMPKLQEMLEENFHMVQPEEVEQYRDKVSAILALISTPVTEELVASFPNLKVIGNNAVGYEHVDVKACARRGIRVGYTPDVLNATTADMGWALLLATAGRVLEGDKISKSPHTKAFDAAWFGYQVSGTTLGIIGMGRIGREVAKRAAGFDMKVLYYNPRQQPRDIEMTVNAQYVPTLTDLLKQSDHVILVAPSTKETYKMMGRDQFNAMKSTATFVNIARGTLVNHDALAEALKNGVIGAAGLDVTDPEPLPRNHPLLTLPNVTITPHRGTAILETRSAMLQMTIDNILAALKGEEMINEI